MTPAVAGEAVFVGSCSGRFYAFDRQSGDVRWVYETEQDGPPANFHGDAVVTDELIVVGSDVARPNGTEEGQVYAFEQASGRPRWKLGVVGGVISDILRAEDRVFGVSAEGELLCIGLDDGRILWRVAPPSSASSSLRYSPVLLGDRVVFSSPGGHVIAVDADSGSTVWTHLLDAEVNTSLVRSGDDLFVGTQSQLIYRLDAATGQPEAPYAAEGFPYGTPVVVEGSVLFLIGGRDLTRIDADLGSTRWSATTEGEWSSFRPLVYGGEVLVGNDQGELAFVNLSSGQVKTTLPVKGTVRGFTLTDGLLHVGTLSGTLYTYRR